MNKVTPYFATGRRKCAVARVRLVKGTGKIIINEKPIEEYVVRKILEVTVREPLVITNTVSKFDVLANAHGGGISGQAGAIRHGIARALLIVDENFRSVLKKAGMLTRDPRMRERKKYGRKRARKRFQFSKR